MRPLGSVWATISIGLDPVFARFGGVTLGWHGLLTAIALAAGVLFGVRMALRRGFTEDESYAVVFVGVPCAVIGARLLYVIDNLDRIDSLVEVVRIDEGGISILGAVIGSIAGGLSYGILKKMPLRPGLDAGALGLIVGMGIGRAGCLILGDYVGSPSGLPWAVEYTHLDSPAFGLGPMHPAVAYEMFGDFAILAALLLLTRVYRRDGLLFFTFLLAYSVMRFSLNFLREDYTAVGPLDSNQVIFLVLAAGSLLGFAYSSGYRPGKTNESRVAQ